MFQIGDRVVINKNFVADPGLIGRQGTIIEVDRLTTGGLWPLKVNLDVVEDYDIPGFRGALVDEDEVDIV